MDKLDLSLLRTVCQMDIASFGTIKGMQTLSANDPGRMHYFFDRGANVLAVAHLDTVQAVNTFMVTRGEKSGAQRVYAPQLDDRLGAYLLLCQLASEFQYDILLTVGEETCTSSAYYFDAPRSYNWTFAFDRAGTDIVLYQYEDADLVQRLLRAGGRVGIGSYSDIADLAHLGCKGINFGCGYYDNHSPRAYMRTSDTFHMVDVFRKFYAAHKDTRLVHKADPRAADWQSRWAYIAPMESQADLELQQMYGLAHCPECGAVVEPDEYSADLDMCLDCAYWYAWGKNQNEGAAP